MRHIKRKNFWTGKKVLLLLISLLAVFFAVNWQPLTSSADTNVAVDYKAPVPSSSYIAGNDRTPWYAVGRGAFNGTLSWVKIYIPLNQAATISIHENCSLDVGEPVVHYYMESLADGSNQGASTEEFDNGQPGIHYSQPISSPACSSSNTDRVLSFPRVSKTAGAPSAIKGHEGYRAFYLIADIDEAPGDNERSFRVQSSNHNVLIGAATALGGSSYVGDQVENDHEGFGIYQRDAQSYGSQEWNYEVELASTCSDTTYATNHDAHVYLFDSDNGIYSPQDLSMEIDRVPRQTNPDWSQMEHFNDATGGWDNGAGTSFGRSHFGGQGSHDDFKFPAKNTYIYKVRVKGINWHNTLQMIVPFDQIDALPTGVYDGSCSPQPQGGNSATLCNELSVTDLGSYQTYNTTQTIVKVNNIGGGNDPLVNEILSDGQSKTWDYTPTQQSIAIHITRQYKDSSGWHNSTDGTRTYTCYHATCTITSITGDGPGGAVVGGGSAFVAATVSNPAYASSNPGIEDRYVNLPLSSSVNGHHFSMTTDSENDVSISIPVGGSQQVTFEVDGIPNNPTTPTTRTLSAYPDYYGMGSIGLACGGSTSYSVYEPFNIGLSANVDMAGGNENPSSIHATTTVHNAADGGAGPTVLLNTTSSFKRGATTLSSSSGGTYGSGATNPLDATLPNPTPVAGDTYCAKIDATYTKGYVGPGGSIVGQGAPGSTNSCQTVYNKPYVHFLGNDVSTGGGYSGGTCMNTAGSGNIRTFFNPAGASNGPSGSGAQIGALSIGNSYGFHSALLRGSDPKPPAGLTFANNVVGTVGSGASNAGSGGQLGGKHCVADYASALPDSVKASPDNNNSAPPGNLKQGGTWYYVPTTGTLTLRNLQLLGAGKNTTVFVKGNVHIQDDITYANSDNYGSLQDVPSFTLVAIGGDITIDAGVRQLDGIYVSQAQNGTGGNIYTCNTNESDIGSVLQNCDQQLVVNGQFVADKVHLLRSLGSLRDASAGEHYSVGAPVRSCSGYGGPVASASNDCAGEVFNFSPEIYLSQPNLMPTSGPTKGTYDFIAGLPPTL